MVASIVTFAVALAIMLIILKIMGKSIKFLTAILINSLVGALILYLLHMFVPAVASISWWSALITGFFGVPGIILVIVLQLIVL